MTTTAAPFDPALVGIERKRFSTTQGEVLVTYAGQRIEQYGDTITLVGRDWLGQPDAVWRNVAEREAIARGLATPILTGAETVDELLWLGVAVAHVALYYDEQRRARQLRQMQDALRYCRASR